MRKAPWCFCICLLLLGNVAGVFGAEPAAGATVSGVVRTAAGAAATGAEVTLLDAGSVPVATRRTGADGRFTFTGVPPGRYVVTVATATGERFARVVDVSGEGTGELILAPAAEGMTERVTVTATPGVPQETGASSQAVSVIDSQDLDLRAKTVLAQAAAEEPGLHLQRTSPTIGAIYVRGFTGAKVNTYVDGVRFSTAAARGGVNTFFNLFEADLLDGLEVLRGPSGAQYGSDAIGGSVQLQSRAPVLGAAGPAFTGSAGVGADSADRSAGASFGASWSKETFGLTATVAGKRVGETRPGEGIDSHNAVTRFFELPSTVIIDDQLPDTEFQQYGGAVRFAWRMAEGHNLSGAWLHDQMENGQRYDQLLGGDGNLVADLDHVTADLLYAKYERTLQGWFDRLELGLSYNTQREERINQGGNGNPNASITHEPERTSVWGMQGLLTGLTARHAFSVGADAYVEGVDAPSVSENPNTGVTTVRRGRIPDGATFRQAGLYVQDTFEAVPGRLQIDGSLRWSGAEYEAKASDSPLVGGEPLWPDDELSVSSLTYRLGGIVTFTKGIQGIASISSGFRVPSITDLGTLGLTGSGFEVSAPDVEGLGGTVGTTADANAVSTGDPVRQLEPEESVTYEGGFRMKRGWFETEIRAAITNLDDNIAKQTLILPPGAVGTVIGDETITAQNANGAVFVAASSNPVLVRANFDRAQVAAYEGVFVFALPASIRLRVVATSLRAKDRDTGLPPNIEGGTPPPEAYLLLRWAPKGRPFWVEPYLHVADTQTRLSTLDLGDRRTGASRSASSIASFFNNGARARGLINNGGDLTPNTPDDFLIPTGETLAQVQSRVLGPGLQSSSLYTEVPSYTVFGVRGAYRFEKSEILVDLGNLGDENYRGPSWGMDAPGRGIYFRFNTRF